MKKESEHGAQTQNNSRILWNWEVEKRAQLIDSWKDRETDRVWEHKKEDGPDGIKKLLAVRLELAYLSRGMTHYDKGDLDKALADYDKAIELNPNLELAYLARGVTYVDINEMTKAIKDFKKCLKLANFPIWKTAQLGLEGLEGLSE